jgi:hypothetical protein
LTSILKQGIDAGSGHPYHFLPFSWIGAMAASSASIAMKIFLAWLAILAMISFYKLWKNGVRLTDMLRARSGGENLIGDRLQNFALFLFIVGSYVLSAVAIQLDPVRPSMPDVSDTLLIVLTGSSGLYLAGKIYRQAA